MGESFESWECRLDSCSVALNAVTKNTYLLIVASDPRVGKFEEIPLMAVLTLPEPAMLAYNIDQCRLHFAEVGALSVLKRKCGYVIHQWSAHSDSLAPAGRAKTSSMMCRMTTMRQSEIGTQYSMYSFVYCTLPP
jgi:hypothetical protein